jgi:hypothetical protein
MANAVLWDAHPSAEVLIATTGTLKNLANNAIAVSDECENGTGLKRYADFELYVHDFAGTPSAGAHFELHIVYQLDGTNYADGEDGDLADANLGPNTSVGSFAIIASQEDQRVQLMGVSLKPHDFKACVVNKTGQAIPNTDGSVLNIYRYTDELQ